MRFALFASFLWGIGAVLLPFPSGPLFSLVPVAISVLPLQAFVRETYPFWIANAQPQNRAFVYLFRAMALFGLALLLLVLRLQITEFVAQVVPDVSSKLRGLGNLAAPIASIPVLACGGYNIYVYLKIREKNLKRAISKQDLAQEVEKKTTGKWATPKDLEVRDYFKPEGYFMGTQNDKPVFVHDVVHVMSFGGPGTRKTVSCAVPNILHWKGSLFVTDPKGELAAMTADHRRALGNQIVFLNPWEVLGTPNTPFNPLQILLKDVRNTAEPTASAHLKYREIGDAKVIAEMLLPDPKAGDDQNGWVRRGGREILIAFMLLLASQRPGSCSLTGLRNALHFDRDAYLEALYDMCGSTTFKGELRNYGNSLLSSFSSEPQQHANCLSEARQSLQTFVSYGCMGDAVSVKAKFDMEKFVKKPTTIYLTVPGEHREANQAWMRLVVANAVEAVGRVGTAATPCLFMLDEFANLGRLSNILKALAEYRGNGLRGWLIVQDREQLSAVYPGSEGKALLNQCDIHQILGCKFDHAKEISETLGKAGYVKTDFQDRPEFDTHYKEGHRTVSVDTKDLMSPGDVMSIDSQVLVLKKSANMLLDKCSYWEVYPWNEQTRPNPLEAGRVSNRPPKIKINYPPQR